MSDSDPETTSYNSDDGTEPETASYNSDDGEPNFDQDEGDSNSEDGDDVVKPKINIGAEINETVLDDEFDFGGLEDEDEDEEDSQSDDEEGPEQVSAPMKLQPQEDLEYEDTEDEDSSDEEDEDDNYLKKFDREVISNYVDVYHPESRMHNYDEVRTLSSVVRGANGDVVDDLHRTLPFLTKFEKARILGLRAKQLDEGAQPFVKVPPNAVTGYTIALMELEQKNIPFIIRRPIPGGGSEYWKVSDLELII